MEIVKIEPQKANLMVNIFDGTRKPISGNVEILIRVIDGNQNQVSANFYKSSSVLFQDLPVFDNFGDNYRVIAWAKNYRQAGFSPVKISRGMTQHIDLMLLPVNADYDFKNNNHSEANWDALAQSRPNLISLFKHGAPNDNAAKARYNNLIATNPDAVAALLNITTAMSQVLLPFGNPLDYFKELIWDDSMAKDRFFGYADKEIVNQVKRAVQLGVFKPETTPNVFHPGATSSYKQVQFGEANIQLTFHELDTKTIDNIECIKVEPDIDYFQDLLAHALLEVIPNTITGSLTDPKQVYILRWIAGRHAGVPEFNPPYILI